MLNRRVDERTDGGPKNYPSPNQKSAKMETPPRTKRRSLVFGDQEHRRSIDDVGMMLSRLPLKDAIVTSSVCKGWRSKWTAIDSLDFDPGETLPGYWDEADREVKDSKTRNYVDWVTHVLRQLGDDNDRALKLFRVFFFEIDKRFSSEIDEWVQFAMKRRVQVLILDFLSYTGDNSYTFPHRLIHDDGCCFEYLKTLELEGVDVTEDVLGELLCNCPNLERLLVRFTRSLVKVALIGPLLLKSLAMGCNRGLKAIEIRNAPHLASLSYSGFPIHVVVENVPLMSEVCLSYLSSTKDCIRLPFTQLSSCVSQLHTLMMDIHNMDFNVYYENHAIPELPNLKRFELVVYVDFCSQSLHLLTSFLKAFPHLCTLVLKLQFTDPFSCDPRTSFIERHRKKDVICPHHGLEVLEIVRYRHRLNADEHVRHVIETVIALKKIVINPVHWHFHHTGADKRIHDVKQEEIARNAALNFLKKQVPSTIEFVVL